MRIADMEELLAGYKREGIDPAPYYWLVLDQYGWISQSDGNQIGLLTSASTEPVSTVAMDLVSK